MKCTQTEVGEKIRNFQLEENVKNERCLPDKKIETVTEETLW